MKISEVFPIGTKVQISETSQYYIESSNSNPGQQRTFGVIIRNNDSGSNPYKVNWDNGSSNRYQHCDLLSDGVLKFQMIEGLYFKDFIPSTLKEMLEYLLVKDSFKGSSKNPTYRLRINCDNNKEEDILQCSKDKYRSFDDVLELSKYYFPEATVGEVFTELLLIDSKTSDKVDDNTVVGISLTRCSTIKRGVIHNVNYRIKSAYMVIEDICYDSKYTWKKLLSKININSYEDFLAFYIKHLQNETVQVD